MSYVEPDQMDPILETPIDLRLSANELRILANALNALAFFSARDGEPYIDAEGYLLRARLRKEYENLLEKSIDSEASLD